MTTYHGSNIGNQIAGEDAYGDKGPLNIHDITYIVDQMHTNIYFDENGERPQADNKIGEMLARWLDEAISMGGNL